MRAGRGKETIMRERFWLWVAGAAFAAAILVALGYALTLARDCERAGGVMVRSFSMSGWSCVSGPQLAPPSH
jgi:hypothetical protein